MSNALTQDTDMFIFGCAADAEPAAPAADTKLAAPAADPAQSDAPVGYRWIAKRWRVLPDGTRDYAAYHGKTAFSFLLPVSSRLHTRK